MVGIGSRRVEKPPLSPRSLKIRRVTKWLLALAVAGFLVDALWYEPYHPVLSTYDVAVPGLPKSMDGFRVVQLSDFHRSVGFTEKFISNGVALANSTKADLAVLTGDFVSVNARNALPCCRLLRGLRTRYGSYAVLGNHEYWTDPDVVSRALLSSGIHLLVNENTRVAGGLRLVGLDDEWSGNPDPEAAFDGTVSGEPTLVLCHEPGTVKRIEARPVLVLCGHTHGAVANIPGLVRLLTRFARCEGYRSGWYRSGRTLMYVNRGLNPSFPWARFRNRPDVTLFILHPTGSLQPRLVHRE